jgi:hypothetical protein
VDYRQFLTTRNIIIVAVSVAVIGYLLIHNVGDDILLYAMRGNIWLTDQCQDNSNDEWYCGAVIPYRWLLGVVVACIAGALIARHGKSN